MVKATTDSYAAGLRDDKAVTAATIPAEKVACPMLVIVGDHDLSYPAASMAHSLIPTTVDQSDGLISGGDPVAIGPARRTAWDATLKFLARHIGT